MPVPAHNLGRASAQSALDRALQQSGAARREQIAALTKRYPEHAPIWLALAEEHLGKRRHEEARYAAKKALVLDGSIARQFSSELASLCASMMPPDQSARPRALSSGMRRADEMRARIHNQGDADIELAQAKRLHGLARSERLEQLSRRFPTHAPTWLSLAEEFIAQRRVERSLDAFERAILLDPGQERFASPKLETARRYHDREAAPRYQPAPRAPEDAVIGPSSGFALPVPKSGPNERTRYLQFAQIERPAAKTIPPYLRTASGSYRPARAESQPNNHIGRQLAAALELPNPTQRLGALRALEAQAPEHPGVLFHLAVHMVLADRLDEARRTGQTLSRVDSTRYRQLYEWADEWSRTAQPVAASNTAQANARTLCLELPKDGWPTNSSYVPAMPLAQGYKTQLLAVPVPMSIAHGSSRLSVPGADAYAGTASVSETRSTGRRLRTAGALIAGVAAGLLVAMLLVFVVNSAGSLESSAHESQPSMTVDKPAKSRRSLARESSEGSLTAAEQAVVDSMRADRR
jgi:tetratricopeptide (TPR) repeat protein